MNLVVETINKFIILRLYKFIFCSQAQRVGAIFVDEYGRREKKLFIRPV
jgi:hypothetical protein